MREIGPNVDFVLDPIWLIASVEEGGLMGITQQLEQCHSLGMNANYSQYMNSIPPSHNLLYPSSSANPFQSTRCKLIRRIEFELSLILDVGPSADPRLANANQWSNYPLMGGLPHQPADPSGSSSGMIDDNSLDTF